MSTILIAGIESVAGGNLALVLADVFSEIANTSSSRIRIVGLSFEQDIKLPGIECHTIAGADDAIVRDLASEPSVQFLLCGAAGVSCWEQQPNPKRLAQLLERDLGIAQLAAEFSCNLTTLSSDAVFSGPWVFHDEDSESCCTSKEASLIRSFESEVMSVLPKALIVRTNALGWSSTGDGWLEELLGDLTVGADRVFDQAAHATPILATDLADPLMRAWNQSVCGVLNVAGTERTNEVGIAKRLSLEFGLSRQELNTSAELSVLQTEFGKGETSLQTAIAQDLLESCLPTISDGIRRLYEQSVNGFRDRVHSGASVLDPVG